MKKTIVAGVALAGLLAVACDDNTDEIGSTLIDNMDHLEISTDTFEVSTRSLVADSVYSRSTTGYLGKIRDPETGAYITSDFISQFYILKDAFPPKDSITSYEYADGSNEKQLYADSCCIYLVYSGFYGDSLTTMKMRVNELSEPMSETVKYYSNFDPEANNLIRDYGLKVDKVYSITDLSVSDSLRDAGYASIKIKLDQDYVDDQNNTYNNYGTYLLRKYYSADSVYFNDPYTFIHKVVPGFYFQIKSGLGSMAYISDCRMSIYYRMNTTETETVTDDDGNESSVEKVVEAVAASVFYGTEEVLQTTRITNDKSTISRLADEDSCTYIKSPAGIFTEITLPVDEITYNHDNDTINTAKVTLTRINDKTHSDYALDIPQTLLMIPKDEMYSFFEEGKIADYKTSYLASYDSSNNTYTFNNISSLVKHLDRKDRTDSDWNKVVVIPVTATYSTYNSTQVLTKVEHDMSMTSTRLVGGSENNHSPIKISVVYSKFK